MSHHVWKSRRGAGWERGGENASGLPPRFWPRGTWRPGGSRSTSWRWGGAHTLLSSGSLAVFGKGRPQTQTPPRARAKAPKPHSSSRGASFQLKPTADAALLCPPAPCHDPVTCTPPREPTASRTCPGPSPGLSTPGVQGPTWPALCKYPGADGAARGPGHSPAVVCTSEASFEGVFSS